MMPTYITGSNQILFQDVMWQREPHHSHLGSSFHSSPQCPHIISMDSLLFETFFVLTASSTVSWDNRLQHDMYCTVWRDMAWHSMVCISECPCVAEWMKHQIALGWFTIMCRLTAYKTVRWASDRKLAGHCSYLSRTILLHDIYECYSSSKVVSPVGQ